jgi:acetolactate synthase-1/3 small subunit
MERKHTISVLVENEFGVLARIAGLFSSKGYNIDSLSVSETMDPTLSRMTIVTHGSDHIVVQILKQLNKLVNVLTVEDLTEDGVANKNWTREMCLVKLKTAQKSEVLKKAEALGARVLENTEHAIVLEITSDQEGLMKAIDSLAPLGILEMVRTGLIALEKGKNTLLDQKLQ